MASTLALDQKKRPPKRKSNSDDAAAPKRKVSRYAFKLPLPDMPKRVGRVLVCGHGDFGQLGLGDTNIVRKRPALVESLENVVDVCAGGMHNVVLTKDGRVYSFGCNDEGALGRDCSDVTEFVPGEIDLPGKALIITAGDSHTACLLEDGSVYAFGCFRGSSGSIGLSLDGNQRLAINILPNIECCSIASGADHLVILSCAGKVYTVGCAEAGQLGRISMRSLTGEGRRGKSEILCPCQVHITGCKYIDVIWATSYGTFLRDAITHNIWAFGLNNYKQLVIRKETMVVTHPSRTSFENVKQISGGMHHTLVLKNDGKCSVIGRPEYGRLGLGIITENIVNLQAINALKDKTILSISCGDTQSFAVADDGELYSWGMNSCYQLGTGCDEDAYEPLLVASKQTLDKDCIRASGGGQHSIFLVADKVDPQPSMQPTASATSIQQEEKHEATEENNEKLTVAVEVVASESTLDEVEDSNVSEHGDSTDAIVPIPQ